jgi:polyferredoxin
LKRLSRRLKEDSQFLRSVVQAGFAALCVWIGVEFYLFVRWGASGGTEPFVQRPPGAEGFLPISALISLNHWVQTGTINDIHPSALFILIAIIAVSWVARKAFCSWLCPIGTLSESLWLLGKKIFGRNLNVPRWLDYPLRSLKYLLLFFFVWSILQMNVRDLTTFIYSPYNKVADVKMFMFFSQLSEFAFWTLLVLVVLSVPIRNFWCRFLCPYGALLGIAGWLSPLKITRTKSTCIDCELCTRACPSNIKVHAIGAASKESPVGRVWSDECTSCLACVEACPVKETLDVRISVTRRPVPSWAFGLLVVGLFAAVTGAAMLTGHWHNAMSSEEYLFRFQRLDSYQHFQGQVPEYGPND